MRLHDIRVSDEEKAFETVRKKPSNGVLAGIPDEYLMRHVFSDVE